MHPVLCIVGPTASGKTALSVELAKRFDGEIVSADSMQLYRGIHIASAAPDTDEQQGIPHHLVEVLDLTDCCTVADYTVMAKRAVNQIEARGHLPIIVGGTGLYVDALLSGTRFVPDKINPALRQRLTETLESIGAKEMLRRLAAVDPQTAERLHPNDTRRIIRAFEIYESTGKTVTRANAESHLKPSEYRALWLGLCYADRAKLYDRINRRVLQMLERGLVEEARSTLFAQGGAMQAIGHKELYPYLRGEISLDDAVAALQQATRHYAKRQMTWFRRNPDIHWIEMDGEISPLSAAIKIIEEWRNADEGQSFI